MTRHRHTTACAWGSEDDSQEWVLPFHHAGPGAQTEVVTSGDKSLSHLISPNLLPRPPECWDYRHVALCPVLWGPGESKSGFTLAWQTLGLSSLPASSSQRPYPAELWPHPKRQQVFLSIRSLLGPFPFPPSDDNKSPAYCARAMFYLIPLSPSRMVSIYKQTGRASSGK